MWLYVLKRLGFLVVLALGVSVVVFIISRLLPTDPAVAVLGFDATPAMIENLRREVGLDRPLHEQYIMYLGRLVRGDFGLSLVTRHPVLDDLLQRYPATIELTVGSLLLATIVGVPLGAVSALRRGEPIDHVTRVASITASSIPVFWLGLMLQVIFYGYLGWLPAAGRIGGEDAGIATAGITGFLTVDAVLRGDLAALWGAIRHLVLPVITLASLTMALVARMTRSAVLDVLHEPYVTVAHAKGLANRVVIWSYILKNAGIPILTVIGLRFGGLLGGAVLTETIFSWPGVGHYAVTAILNNDLYAVMGFMITVTLLYALVNLLVDLSYPLLDPRVQL
ncbi:MAG: ABC transporter permease [Chloroflexi bacterium]|nr:ABC transporter permease [Chloroflexota bacterium]